MHPKKPDSYPTGPLLHGRRSLIAGLTGLGTLAMVPASWAQFRVEVSGVGLTQLPIAIAAFRGDAQSPQKIAAIVQADLEEAASFALWMPAGTR